MCREHKMTTKNSTKKKKLSKMKCVSFRIHNEKDVLDVIDQKSTTDSHEAGENKHSIWYTQQELEVFKHQARLETKKFRHSCHPEEAIHKCGKMRVASLLEPWSNSSVEMKTILLSELDNYRLSSSDIISPNKRDTLTTSRGLESRIFYQHQRNKLLAIREILKYHKKSLALIQEVSKTMDPEQVMRLRKISAYKLACLSSKCSSWARQMSLKMAQLDRASVMSYYEHSSTSPRHSSSATILNILREKRSLNQSTEPLKRKHQCSNEEAPLNQTMKKPRRNALSFGLN